MKIHRSKRNEPPDTACWLPENTVEIHQKSLQPLLEKIRKDKNCRYPLVTLQILLQVMCEMQPDGTIHISARHLSKKLDVHYDTVTKCLKYLRATDFFQREEQRGGKALSQGKKSYRINPFIASSKTARAKIPDYGTMNIVASGGHTRGV